MSETADEFVRYVQPLQGRLHRVARRYAAREEQVRDLVQETLLRAWRGYSPSPGNEYHASWLFVILRNVALDWSRLASRRVQLVPVVPSELTDIAAADPMDPFMPLPGMTEAQFREFLDDRLVSALDGLDPVFREVVVLSVAGELNYREVAEVLDCPVGTVMSRIGRARRALRESLADCARAKGWTVRKES